MAEIPKQFGVPGEPSSRPFSGVDGGSVSAYGAEAGTEPSPAVVLGKFVARGMPEGKPQPPVTPQGAIPQSDLPAKRLDQTAGEGMSLRMTAGGEHRGESGADEGEVGQVSDAPLPPGAEEPHMPSRSPTSPKDGAEESSEPRRGRDAIDRSEPTVVADSAVHKGTVDQFGIVSFQEAHSLVTPEEQGQVRSIFGPRVNSLFAAHEDFIDRDVKDGVASESLSLIRTTPDNHRLKFSMKRTPGDPAPPAFDMEVRIHEGENLIRGTLHEYYADGAGVVHRQDTDMAQLIAGVDSAALFFGNTETQAAVSSQLEEQAEQAHKGREDEEQLGINRRPVGVDEVSSVLRFAEQAGIATVSFEELQVWNLKRLEEAGPSPEETQQAATEFGDIVNRFLNRRQDLVHVDEHGNRELTFTTTSEDGTKFSVHVTQSVDGSGVATPQTRITLCPSPDSSKYSTVQQLYWVDDGELIRSATNTRIRQQPNNVATQIAYSTSALVGRDDARLVRNFLHDPREK